MKYKQKNHDKRNMFVKTIAAAAIPLAVFAAHKLGVFDKRLEARVEEPNAKVSVVQESNNVNEVNSVNGVNDANYSFRGINDSYYGVNENNDSKSIENVNEVNDSNHSIKNVRLENITKVDKPNYSKVDRKLLTNVSYGEAADQSRRGRKLITRMTLNRVREKEYLSNIKDVIYDHLAISCIKDKKNKNWKQATGKLPRNEYEEMIYQRCGEDVNSILDGERLGIQFEDEIISYHDTSVSYKNLVAKEKKIQEKWEKKGKSWNGYWMHLEPVVKEGDLIFYKEKSK